MRVQKAPSDRTERESAEGPDGIVEQGAPAETGGEKAALADRGLQKQGDGF